eukprot:5560961-Amphidinium_carterae.1
MTAWSGLDAGRTGGLLAAYSAQAKSSEEAGKDKKRGAAASGQSATSKIGYQCHCEAMTRASAE